MLRHRCYDVTTDTFVWWSSFYIAYLWLICLRQLTKRLLLNRISPSQKLKDEIRMIRLAMSGFKECLAGKLDNHPNAN